MNIKKIIGSVLLTVVVLGVAYFFFHISSPQHKSTGVFWPESKWQYANLVQSGVLYPVVHVVDGDTVIAHVPDPTHATGRDVTIRLIGMDTPETVDPRKPVQCYGPEASAKAKELLASTSVYIERDPLKGDYEKYGRVLAYVRMPDGNLYNEYMIQNGFAHEYTYSHEPYKYQKEFKADQLIAQKARLGLWGKCSSS